MSGIEKAVVLGALTLQALLIAFALAGLNSGHAEPPSLFESILNPICFLLSIAAFVFIVRDLYKRPFPNPNAKITWLLVMFFTGGIGVIIYVFRHAVHPRTNAADA